MRNSRVPPIFLFFFFRGMDGGTNMVECVEDAVHVLYKKWFLGFL